MQADLTNILKQICETSGWKYGEVWIPDSKLMRLHPAYYMVSEELADFRKESESFTFAAGAGLPGRVWMMQKPEWIENVELEPAIYYRSHLAKKAGLKAGLGVPILASGEVVAVVAFYNDVAIPPNEELIAEFNDRIQTLILEFKLAE
nr:GAF domain-containing protein [Argonema galeatum]